MKSIYSAEVANINYNACMELQYMGVKLRIIIIWFKLVNLMKKIKKAIKNNLFGWEQWNIYFLVLEKL